jgi:hypothetical protein
MEMIAVLFEKIDDPSVRRQALQGQADEFLEERGPFFFRSEVARQAQELRQALRIETLERIFLLAAEWPRVDRERHAAQSDHVARQDPRVVDALRVDVAPVLAVEVIEPKVFSVERERRVVARNSSVENRKLAGQVAPDRGARSWDEAQVELLAGRQTEDPLPGRIGTE